MTEQPAHSRYARVVGSPGTRVRMAGLLRTQWPLLIVVALAGYLLRAAVPHPPIGSTLAGILFLALAVAVAAAANHSRVRLQAFLKGARGEEVAARALALLPDTFTVFHGLAAHGAGILTQGGGDLDHVVVGPSGIFVIETKNWAGAITIHNGELTCDGSPPSRPPLDQAKSAAAALRSRLRDATGVDTPVTPMLCFASNRLSPGQQGSAGVLVCNADQLTDLILASNDSPLADPDRNAIIKTLEEGCDP
jgi:hypothetical protein